MGMQKKQTAVSHSSTEAEMTSLDTDLRMGGLVALTLWDIVTDVSEPLASDSSRQRKPKTMQEAVDYGPPNAPGSSNRAQVFLFEDNETVIKMIINQGQEHMRHVS